MNKKNGNINFDKNKNQIEIEFNKNNMKSFNLVDEFSKKQFNYSMGHDMTKEYNEEELE